MGSIKDIFAKIKTIDAKHGKFDFAVCAGDFFGPMKEEGHDDELSHFLGGNIEGAHAVPSAVLQCWYSCNLQRP